ncbi:MAG: YmfQ family protein [Oscillospiraceae bacterium]|nr:YmfQ family protein [Oscillospiraceae bacterium]
MIKFLPGYYRKSQVLKDLYSVLQAAFERTEGHINAEDLKLFITTTDDFTRHEKDVGLSFAAADDETRRSRVIARLRGNDVLTLSALEDIVTLYEPTGCVITEDYSNYVVYIDMIGRADNFDTLRETIEELKPAHITIYYAYESTIEPVGTMYIGGIGMYDKQEQSVKAAGLASSEALPLISERFGAFGIYDRQTQYIPASNTVLEKVTGTVNSAANVVYDRQTITI